MAKNELGLDPKKFKHVKSDDKTTTLQHQDGHQLIVAHAALSKKMQDQLKALSNISKDAQTSTQKNEDKASDGKMNTMADGGMLQTAMKLAPLAMMLADGGEVDPNAVRTENPDIQPPQQEAPAAAPVPQQPDPSLQAQKDLYNQKLAASGAVASADDMFGPNGEPPKNPVNPTLWGQVENSNQAQQLAAQQISKRDELTKSNDSVQTQMSEHEKAVAQNAVNARLGLPPVPDPGAPVQKADGQMAPGVTPDSQSTMATGLAQGAGQSQAPSPTDAHDPESMLASGYNRQMAGINAEANAKGALGEQQSAMLDQQVKAQQDSQASFQAAYNKLNGERDAAINDVKAGYINPERYWTGDPKTGEGGHSKIAAGIGMILAGFNPTNSPNAAINFLKYQMDRNLEAQKTNLASKETLLNANLRQFGNLRDATEMTRIMQNDMLSHQLQSAAAKAASPMAKAAALQAAGQLQMQTAPMFQQFAMRRAMMNMADNASASGDPSNTAAQEHMLGYMRMVNPEMAKEMESRLIPNVGMAKVPVPTDDRREIIGKQNFDQMAKHYVDWAKKNSGSLSPSKIKEGATMAAELQGAYRQAVKGGVFKEGEQEFIEKLIPSDPSQFAASMRTIPKVQELIRSNNTQLNSIKKGYGLPVKEDAQTQIVTGKDGHQYRKVPGGYQKIK